MNELKIKPSVPLCDREQEAILNAKRRALFDSQYRPKHPLVEHWPAPSTKLYFGMPPREVLCIDMNAARWNAWAEGGAKLKPFIEVAGDPPDLRGYPVLTIAEAKAKLKLVK
jgi:hypothetical protein